MGDKKEYIERGALIEMLNNKAKTDHEMGLYNHGALTESFIRFVERQPAADVVEVVRCEKCIFSGECTESEKLLYLPETVICERIKGRNPKFKDDFCSDGKRKEQT